MRLKFKLILGALLAPLMALSLLAQEVWVNHQAARLVIGQSSFTEQDPDSNRSVLGAAGGVAVAGNRLFVADGNRIGAIPLNHRVLIFNNLSGFIDDPDAEPAQSTDCPACAGVPDVVLGQPDFDTSFPSSSTDSDADFDTRNGMENPIAVASDGRILVVADTDNNRVLIWDHIPTTNGERPTVVVGQPDRDETAPATTREGMRGPQGVWVDGGRLFVADTANSRILIYNSIPTDHGQPADIVVGQPDFESRNIPDFERLDGQASMRSLFVPVSVTAKNGRMFVTDLGHHRVLIYNTIPQSSYWPADVVIGQPDMEIGVANNTIDLCEEIPPADDDNEEKERCVRCDAAGCRPVRCDRDDDDDGEEFVPDEEEEEEQQPTYPIRCAATLSFPRFALSDGERLFIADGGNDRILGFDRIPGRNGARADFVLGQPDFESAEVSDGAGHVRAPVSLAHDGQNLYVADPFSRRVLVFTPGEDMISMNGIRNGASFSVHAMGSVMFTDPPDLDEDDDDEGDTDLGEQEVIIRVGVEDDGDSRTKDDGQWKYEFEFTEDLSALQVRDIMLGMINADFSVQPDPVTGELPTTPPVYAVPMVGEGISAQARVEFGGDLRPGDQVFLQIGDETYEHTVLEPDTDIETYILVDRFAYFISNRPDPLVVAERDPADGDLLTLLITARQVGSQGNSIPISVSTSENSLITASVVDEEQTLRGGSLQQGIRLVAVKDGTDGNAITLSSTKRGNGGITVAASGATLSGGHDARELPPGTMAALFGKNLADNVFYAPAVAAELPKELGGIQVFANGILCPLYSVTPEQINFQVPFETTGTSASVSVRRRMPDGSAKVSVPRAINMTRAAPGLFAYEGREPRRGVVLHASTFAQGSISLSLQGGTTEQGIEIGDRVDVTVTIRDRPYTYRTNRSDTLSDIRDGIIQTVNAGSGDPDVVASASTRGFFSARADIVFSGEIAEGDEVFVYVRDRTYSYVVQEDDTLVSVRNILVETINGGGGDPEVTARRLDDPARMQVIAREIGESGNSIPFRVSTSRNAAIELEVPEPEDDDEIGFLAGGQALPSVLLTARQGGPAGNDITYDAESAEEENLLVTPSSSKLCCGNDAFSPVTDANPAIPGEKIIVFGTGLGLTAPLPASIGLKSGQVTPDSPLLTVPFNADDFVASLAGGRTATVDFVGLMPGTVGVYQINLELNSSLPDNPETPLTIFQRFFVSNSIVFPVKNRIAFAQ